MKKKVIPIIFFLLIVLIYVTNITAIPDSIILFKNEDLNLGNIVGVTTNIKDNEKYVALRTSTAIKNDNISEQVTVELSLFNTIPIKDITVNVIPTTTVIPVGTTARIKVIYRWGISCRYV